MTQRSRNRRDPGIDPRVVEGNGDDAKLKSGRHALELAPEEGPPASYLGSFILFMNGPPSAAGPGRLRRWQNLTRRIPQSCTDHPVGGKKECGN